MKLIVYLLTSRMAGSVLSVVVILLMFALLGQCQATGHAKRALAKSEKVVVAVQADLSTCKANTSALKSALDGQNRAVEALKAEGEARIAESRKAVSAARSVAESYRREAVRVLAVKPGSADRCEAASMLIAGEVK